MKRAKNEDRGPITQSSRPTDFAMRLRLPTAPHVTTLGEMLTGVAGAHGRRGVRQAAADRRGGRRWHDGADCGVPLGRDSTAALLLAHGADASLTNRRGESALALAGGTAAPAASSCCGLRARRRTSGKAKRALNDQQLQRDSQQQRQLLMVSISKAIYL